MVGLLFLLVNHCTMGNHGDAILNQTREALQSGGCKNKYW